MATTDEVTIETEIEPTNTVTTEQPTAGGLNVQKIGKNRKNSMLKFLDKFLVSCARDKNRTPNAV